MVIFEMRKIGIVLLVIAWFLQNKESSTGKFSPYKISEDLDIPLKEVVNVINQL